MMDPVRITDYGDNKLEHLAYSSTAPKMTVYSDELILCASTAPKTTMYSNELILCSLAGSVCVTEMGG